MVRVAMFSCLIIISSDVLSLFGIIILSVAHPDVQQSLVGSCRLEDVAVRVLTRVIGHYPHRNQLLVDCGWTALSHDGGGRLPTGYAIIEGHPELK